MEFRKIGCIIVCYNPEKEVLEKSIQSISKQVYEILIIDNNSKSKNYQDSDVIALQKNITIINLSENKGITGALNLGFSYFINKNCFDWILTLDQDSICPEEMISKFVEYTYDDGIGIIVPALSFKNDVHQKFNLAENFDSNATTDLEIAITSGSLCNVKAYQSVKGFDEVLFIDYVDFDYCKMIKKNGFRILRINDVVMEHSLGETLEKKKFPFIKNSPMILTYNHSSIRKYYFIRNGQYYIFKHRDSINVKSEYKELIRQFIVTIFYESNKFENFVSMCKGYISGKILIRNAKRKEGNYR